MKSGLARKGVNMSLESSEYMDYGAWYQEGICGVVVLLDVDHAPRT